MCGGGCSKISATHVGCSNARNKGEAVCNSRRTVKLADLEDSVLEALRTRLLAPEIYAAFVRGFTAEWNVVQKGRAVAQEGQRDEMRRITCKIGNVVDTIGKGNGSAAILAALKETEARQAAVEADVAPTVCPRAASDVERGGAVSREGGDGAGGPGGGGRGFGP